FYNPNNETIGYTTNGAMPSKASFLAVAGHEFTHSVTHHKVDSSFFNNDDNFVRPSINEAYSDIFGSFIDDNSWRDNTNGTRYIADPANSTPTALPDSMSSVNFNSAAISGHHNSTVISHAAFLMGPVDIDGNPKDGLSFTKLRKLWYASYDEGYDAHSDFYTVRTNVIKSARKNGFSYNEISIIKKAFDDVEVLEATGNVTIRVLDGDVGVSSATITLINYGRKTVAKIRPSDNGTVTISDVEIGTNTIKVNIPGQTPIFAHVLVLKDKTVSKTIKFITSMSFDNFDDYTIYDHYNWSEPYGTVLSNHIEFDGNSIKMLGYTKDALKDFVLISDEVSSISEHKQVLLSFNIKRDESNNWHTMEGGGFLFNSSVTDDNKLKGYCILVTQQGLKLYYISGVDVDLFRDGKAGNISSFGQLLGTYNIGNVLDNHEITLRIIGQKITLWDGDAMIIESYRLPHNTGLHDFGPITSHTSHSCSQVSFFTFSNIRMNVVTESLTLSDIIF
ncbi:MAG: M4 family metallopeptidase, partial [Oscillospiraceae bacterium]|nr:M4 family metallopeptidase [Oscillospiraceae bacterium]